MNPIIEKGRITKGYYATTADDGCNGAFEIQINGELLRVIASDGEGWKHVSVSKVGSKRVPNWDMMCHIKDLFFGDSVWVMQFHPPKSEYVNNHPGCLHLWMPTDERIPTPPSIMTGHKGMTPEQVAATPISELRKLAQPKCS